MKIEKEIKSKIERDFFFVEGSLENIDSDYFINKIEEGILLENNLSYKTNVMGKVTPWFYFSKDKNFIYLVNQLIDYVEIKKITTAAYTLLEAWGIKETFADFTQQHSHTPNYLSGVIYLNDHPQKLYFPEIRQENAISIEKSILDKIGEKSIVWEVTGMFSNRPYRITYEEVVDGTKPVQTKTVLGVKVAVGV